MTFGPKAYRTPGLDSYLQPDDDSEYRDMLDEITVSIDNDTSQVISLMYDAGARESDGLVEVVVMAQNLISKLGGVVLEHDAMNALLALQSELSDGGFYRLRDSVVEEAARERADELTDRAYMNRLHHRSGDDSAYD